MRSFIISPVIFTIALIIFSINSQGQSRYVLSDTSIIHRLDFHVGVFIDSSGVASAEDVLATKNQGWFKPSGRNLTFGYLKSPIWLKIQTKNIRPRADWILEIPAPFLEFIDFYQNTNGTWQLSQAGYYRPQSIREISHTNHLLPLVFGSDSLSTVYVKITGLSPKTFPVHIIEIEKFYEKIRLEDLWDGIFFGILFVMFCYNLFIYLTLNQ